MKSFFFFNGRPYTPARPLRENFFCGFPISCLALCVNQYCFREKLSSHFPSLPHLIKIDILQCPEIKKLFKEEQ